jgi:hypothetical protein
VSKSKPGKMARRPKMLGLRDGALHGACHAETESRDIGCSNVSAVGVLSSFRFTGDPLLGVLERP